MKKFYSILVIALMAVALVACGSNEKKSKEKEADAQELSVEKMAEKFAKELVEAMASEDEDAMNEVFERMEAYEATLSDEESEIFNEVGEAKTMELAEAMYEETEKEADAQELSVEKMTEKFFEELVEAYESEDGDAVGEIIERMEAYMATLSEEERVIFNAVGEAKSNELQEAMYE